MERALALRLRRSAPGGALVAALCAALASAQPPEPVPGAADAAGADPRSASAAGESGAPDDAAEQAEASDSAVNFIVDVEPIFFHHCYQCHGPEKQSSGLRLDRKQSAQQGGDSGQSVLGGTPETNPLWQRVSSPDRNYRMPKNGPRLADDELAVLRRWVEQGTPWPDPLPKTVTPEPWRSIDKLALWVARHEAEHRYALPYGLGFLALQVALLIVFRCQRAVRQGRPWIARCPAWFRRFCDQFRPREALLVTGLGLAVVALAVARGHVLVLERERARVAAAQQAGMSVWANSVYGLPPRPVRADRAKRLSATYYRGNCERNPELFNGGNYLTAVFHVALCDRQQQPLEFGQAAPEGGLFIRIEIERAPGTTDTLFEESMMNSVFLVGRFYQTPDDLLQETPVRLDVLEPGQRWAAVFPLPPPSPDGRVTGVIYLYVGQVADVQVRGTPHYAVQYDLLIREGRIVADSDLWMDSFGNPAFAEPAPPGKLPYHEWFDDRPMPIITGPNSTNPKLLGVEEYVEQGLIDAKPPADDVDAAEPAQPPP